MFVFTVAFGCPINSTLLSFTFCIRCSFSPLLVFHWIGVEVLVSMGSPCQRWILLVRCWQIRLRKCNRLSFCCCLSSGFYHNPNYLLPLMMLFHPCVVFFWRYGTSSRYVPSSYNFCIQWTLRDMYAVLSSSVFRLVLNGYLCIFLCDILVFFYFSSLLLLLSFLWPFLYMFDISSVIWVIWVV